MHHVGLPIKIIGNQNKQTKMKKIILLLSVVLMTSCSCLIGQVPHQTLYLDSTCGAALPDYRPLLTFRDNCAIDTIEQDPTPGSWLTTKYTTVLIRAYDTFQNFTDVMFTVELIDTVPPELIGVDSTLITSNFDKITSLYNVADRLLAYEEMYFDSAFDWAAAGIPDSIIPDNQYFNYVMLTWTAPGLAFGLPGQRVHTFVLPGDTIVIPQNF